MKTEREFIDSVYSKYEQEKLKREAIAKRNRTVYFCASLAACFCVVVLGAVRILPSLMGANSAAEADCVAAQANAPESITVTNGSGSVKLSDGAAKFKSYQYTVDEEEALFDVYVEEVAEEAVEAPISTECCTDVQYDREYLDVELAISSVVDCSFDKTDYGYTDIIINGESVGRIITDQILYSGEVNTSVVNSSVSDDLKEEQVYLIQWSTDPYCVISLKHGYFTDEDVEKIKASVQK